MKRARFLGHLVLMALLICAFFIPVKSRAADWTRIISDGNIDGTNGNLGILDIKYANGYTYIMTIYDEDELRPRFFKYDGTNWENITNDAFATIRTLGEIGTTDTMTIYNGLPCFGGTAELFTAVAYCYSGTGTTWNQINQNSFGSNDLYIRMMTTFGGSLYATSASVDGAKVWKYSGVGTDWSQVNVNNFGQPVEGGYLWLSFLAEYNGALYASSYMEDVGTRMWRYSGTGTDWSPAPVTGIDATPDNFIFVIKSFGGYLYAVVND